MNPLMSMPILGDAARISFPVTPLAPALLISPATFTASALSCSGDLRIRFPFDFAGFAADLAAVAGAVTRTVFSLAPLPVNAARPSSACSICLVRESRFCFS